MRQLNTLAVVMAAAVATEGARGQAVPMPATAAAQRAADVWNTQGTTRANGAFDLAASRTVDGSVAVLNGPITVAGTIRGSLVAINADVRLSPGARVDRDLIVIGGTITGTDAASLGGELLQQAELVRYHLSGEHIQMDREPEYDDSWWQRHHIRHEWLRGEAYSDFLYVASRSYNRVEGWSFVAGPRIQRPTSWGAVNVEAFAVGRTAEPMRWDNESVGHDARAELLFGRPIGVALGGHLFDVVQPTENWQLGDDETGLASALLHRDFRDYYGRHGGEIYARLVSGKDAALTLAFSDEQWLNRPARDPWSLTKGAEPWRPNPTADAGAMHLVTTTLHVDTRERELSPFAGWYLNADLEQGGGRITRAGSPLAVFVSPSPENVWYSRAFVDVRRYNRIAPGLALDLRLAGGGWVAGDPLPTQRRLGLGGPGTLPGYAFRATGSGTDPLDCAVPGFTLAGTPAQCDRVALAQVQLRSAFLFDAWRDDRDDDWWRPGFNGRTSWVLFADAGRGWMVSQAGAATSGYDRNSIPSLDSFKLDIGAGVDFSGFGLYWAKALRNAGNEGIRFTMRLQHRF